MQRALAMVWLAVCACGGSQPIVVTAAARDAAPVVQEEPRPAVGPLAIAVSPTSSRGPRLRSDDTITCRRSEVGRAGAWRQLCEAPFVGEHVVAELEKIEDKSEVDLTLTGHPTQEELDTVVNLPWLRRLSVGDQAQKGLPDVHTLEALGALKELEELAIYDAQQLTDIDVLARLRRLRHVRLDDLHARSIEPLRGLPDLESVMLIGAAAESLEPLLASPKLEVLYISMSDIRDLRPLAQLRRLKTLSLRRVDARDLGFVRGLTLLESLDFADNRVKDISPLASLTRLRQLVMSRNEVLDLTPISRLHLGNLEIAQNPLADLSPLSTLPLSWLELSGCKNVRSLAPLAVFKYLNKLTIDGTSVTSLRPLDTVKPINNGLVVPKTVPAAEFERFKRLRPDVKATREGG